MNQPATGDAPCPNCGASYNDHGVGGNCSSFLKVAEIRAVNAAMSAVRHAVRRVAITEQE